jgi:hypothetical protein
MDRRISDVSGDFPFRADRFFAEQGSWFCDTREGVVLGPFVDRQAADSALSTYLVDLRKDGDIWDRSGQA